MKKSALLLGLVIIIIVAIILVWKGCSKSRLEEKGFAVTPSQITDNNEQESIEGINKDSVGFDTQPSNVLLTGISNIRLTTIYKVNLNKRDGTTFVGSNNFLYSFAEMGSKNVWNGNLMPGLEGVYGYNFVNISHYDLQTNKRTKLFEKPVLIKTLYYPSFSNDTLNGNPIKRNYIMVSVYNEDTNKDGFINQKDLRRFFLFNMLGERQNQLVPESYSVFKSEYDSENDLMFVFARFDKNANGQIEDNEPIHIFWIDLKDPTKTGQQY